MSRKTTIQKKNWDERAGQDWEEGLRSLPHDIIQVPSLWTLRFSLLFLFAFPFSPTPVTGQFGIAWTSFSLSKKERKQNEGLSFHSERLISCLSAPCLFSRTSEIYNNAFIPLKNMLFFPSAMSYWPPSGPALQHSPFHSLSRDEWRVEYGSNCTSPTLHLNLHHQMEQMTSYGHTGQHPPWWTDWLFKHRCQSVYPLIDTGAIV